MLMKLKINGNLPYLYVFQKVQQHFILSIAKILCVCIINGSILLAIWTNVFINKVSFTGQDANTFPMEPILTFIAANVKP